MKNVELGRKIQPLHPSVDRDITMKECYSIGYITGIDPQTVAGIMMGFILPNDLFAERLSFVFGEEVVEGIVNDYQPDRHYEFAVHNTPADGFTIYDWMSVRDIKAGDRIKTTDNRWIILSDVIVNKDNVRLFSHGYFVATINDKNHLVVARPKDENATYSQAPQNMKKISEEEIKYLEKEETKQTMVNNMIEFLKKNNND